MTPGCSPIWLPSAGLFSDRGVLGSGYDDGQAVPFSGMTLQQKFDASRWSVERLHPGHRQELEKPIFVDWKKIAYNEGSWIQEYAAVLGREPNGMTALGRRDRETAAVEPGCETLLQPAGAIYLVGDNVSHLVGWQEGAALSSLRAVRMVSERVKSARLPGSGQGEAAV